MRRCPGPAAPRGTRARRTRRRPSSSNTAVDWTIGDSSGQRMISSWPPSASSLTARTATLSDGTPAAGPSVHTRARPSSTRSTERRGGGAAGAAAAASATSSTPGVEAPGEHRRSEGLEVALPRERGVMRFEPLAASSKGREPPLPRLKMNAICARSRCRRARWASSSGAAPRSRAAPPRFAASRLQLGPRRRRARVRPVVPVGGQLGRPLEERGRRGDATAGAGATGRALELTGDRSSRGGRRVRVMPGAAIRIHLGIGRLGQRAVHLLALGHGRRPVHRRAHQRMAEAHAGAERDQLRHLGRRRRLGRDPEPLGRAPEQGHVADRLGRRGQQEPPRVGRERLEAAPEAPLDPPRQRVAGRAARTLPPARQASGRGAAPATRADCLRLADDPVPDPLVEHARQRGGEQGARVAVREPLDGELRQAGERIPGWGSRTANTIAIRSASRRRATNASACAEPRSSHCASSTRHTSGRSSAASARRLSTARATKKWSGWRRPQPEGDEQSILLRAGHPLEPVEHGRAELVQASERELHLRLDARRPRDAASRCARRRCSTAEPSCHPRLAAQDQHPALTGTNALHETVQRLALATPAEQSAPSIAIRHCHRRA